METRWRNNNHVLRWRLLVMFAIFLAFLDTKDADATKDENFTRNLETQWPNREIGTTTEMTNSSSTGNPVTSSYLTGGGGVGTWQEIAIVRKASPLPISALAVSIEKPWLTWAIITYCVHVSVMILRKT